MSNTDLPAATVKRNRMMVLGIFMIPVAIILAATLLFKADEYGYLDVIAALGTSNHGALVAPVRQAGEITLHNEQGEQMDWPFNGHWTLVLPVAADCGEACREKLWLTRQSMVSMGAKATNLRRLLLIDGESLSSDFSDYLGAEHPDAVVAFTTPADLQALLGNLPSGQDPLAGHLYYLADQRGFVMMVYSPDNTYKELISDLKFLLKQSGAR